MFVEWRIWEVLDVCCVKKNLRFRHFSFHHAKSAQRTIARSKRNAWNESKATTPRKAIKASKRWRGNSNTKGVRHHKLFKRKEITKHFSLHHFLWRNIEAISIFESRLKFPCYRLSCNWFEWKLWSAHRQFIKFCRDSHVFFEVKYPFHFTRYCWHRCRKIRSTSYSWFSCDW